MKSKEDGISDSLQADFILASREAQFLFGPKSGVYALLSRLNRASFTIINAPKLPKELPPEQKMQNYNDLQNALKLWNEGIEPLEGLMAPYLNYHYGLTPVALVVTPLVERMRRWRSNRRTR